MRDKNFKNRNHSSLKKLNIVGSFSVLAVLLGLVLLFMLVLKLPVHLALFSGWIFLICVGFGLKWRYDDLEQGITYGITRGLKGLLVFLPIGAIIGTWNAGGIVPAFLYYGLSVIEPSYFLALAFVLSSLVALSTGTSWGTVGTAGVALSGIGLGLGMPPAMTAGAILSGAYFGDKLSPLSDTTVLTASLGEIDVMDHVRAMASVSLIAYPLSLGSYYLLSKSVGSGVYNPAKVQEITSTIANVYHITPAAFIPPLIVLGLLILRVPALLGLTIGAFIGVVWALIFQDMSLHSALISFYKPEASLTGVEVVDNLLTIGGFSYIFFSFVAVVLALGLGGLLEGLGIFNAIGSQIQKRVHSSSGRLVSFTILLSFLGNVFTGALYPSLVLTTKIMKKPTERMGFHPSVMTQAAETGGTLMSAMIPWTYSGIFMASVFGAASLAYAPFMFLSWFSIGLSILFAHKRWFMRRLESDEVEIS
jgi:NhaC family Na+:H+ antiporter